MKKDDLTYFYALKNELGTRFAEKGEVGSADISAWKGKEIFNFQESLVEKTGGRISEKWFYTHIKNESGKLPRIDILNLLAQFLDYNDWFDFKAQQSLSEKIILPEATQEELLLNEKERAKTELEPTTEAATSSFSFKKMGLLSLLSIAFLLVVAYFLLPKKSNVVRFCFFDMDRKEIILQPLEIEVLRENETPLFCKTDQNGCLELAYEANLLKFIVRSPYYQTDTVVRLLSGTNEMEEIPLQTNDYALMIHYFSVSDVENWKRRRAQLEQMLHENAVIFQIYDKARIGMDMLNKQEFIDKLTMPTNSLRNIEIIETDYADEQIVSLRFIQKNSAE